MTPQELLAQFENLGDSCEFGLLQRHYDLEPLSLLRWAGVPLDGLIKGLTGGFAGLFEFDNLKIQPGDMAVDSKYNLLFFTKVKKDDGSRYQDDLTQASSAVQAIYRKESARIRFLLTRFIEDLRGCSRIYIYKCNHGLTHLEMLRLKASLDLYGPQRLLCVVPSSPLMSHGQVSLVASGLKLAALDALAPYDNQERIDLAAWLDICAAAVGGTWAQHALANRTPRSAALGLAKPHRFADEHLRLDDGVIAASVYRSLYRSLLLREPDQAGLGANVEDAVSHRRTLEDALNHVLFSPEYEERFRGLAPACHVVAPGSGEIRSGHGG